MNVSGVASTAVLSGISASRSSSQTSSAASSNASGGGEATNFSDSISLTPEAIWQAGGTAPSVAAASTGGLFSFLNLNLVDFGSVAGVGTAIDTYLKALPGSTVYDSPYTTPSAKFLGDLANLKAAAASGNLNGAQTILAKAKLDAPDDVGTAIETAKDNGDLTGEAALFVEVTANSKAELVAEGSNPTYATAEAIAVQVNSLSENAVNTASSSAQTRTQQITDIAANEAGIQLSVPPTSSDPLINIFGTLLADTSGVEIDQSLANLDVLYGSGTATVSSNLG